MHTPNDTRSAPAARRFWVLAALAMLLPALLFCALGGYAVTHSRRQFEQRAELLTQNLAGAIDRSVSSNLEKIDLALSAVADHLEQQLLRGPLDLESVELQRRS